MSSSGAPSGAGGNASEMSGGTHHNRTSADTWAVADAGGNMRGNTYNGTDSERLQHSYEAIFGPAGRDIKTDPQRHKRHQRWHLPDNLKGRNEYLTDRIDGLITDATSSPFTRNILPYLYLDQPDQKIKWNVYSFDEGMASRVPYESAARVLTQSKTSHAGYAVRQGLAIVMEHNFLASPAGVTNFQNQLKQLVGSIQLTNDLDVHVALLQAASYQRTIDEKYYSESTSLYDQAKKYVDMFGIMQKIPNALDILIEDAKSHLRTWGSQPPTFLLCPSDLTAQLQMTPERTNYITNGPDGLKRLAEGPNLPSYRGLSIIHSQKFSLEPGRKSRNVLKRSVRVAEYYWVDLSTVASYQMYNQKKDMMVTFDRTHAAKASNLRLAIERADLAYTLTRFANVDNIYKSALSGYCLLVRPNIQHEMLTIIAGRGGTTELGATFWGQTELACYDDAQHGIWGMSYKYHERAIVTNERNLIRMFDIAYDGYSGGMDTDIEKLDNVNTEFTNDTYATRPAYTGKSIFALHFPRYLHVPSMPNAVVKMLMQIFVPQLNDLGDEYDFGATLSSDLSFCALMIQEIHNVTTHANTMPFTEFMRHHAETATMNDMDDTHPEKATMRDRLAAEEATINRHALVWQNVVLTMISSLTVSYRRYRPQESIAVIYTRILQHVFTQFRNQVEVMSPNTASTLLTYLTSVTGNIDSDAFRNDFTLLLRLMLADWNMDDAEVQRVRNALPNSLTNNDREQLLTFVLCMIHGIETVHADAVAGNWEYKQNGRTVDHARIQNMLKVYYKDTPDAVLAKATAVMHLLTKSYDDATGSLLDLRYNLHILQKPAFEVPNPLILSSILRNLSHSHVSFNAEGAATTDKNDAHNFKTQFLAYIDADKDLFATQVTVMKTIVEEFFEMYDRQASNLFLVNQLLSASTYIQNNQTELPAMAYHGNMKIDKIKGGQEEVRCVGHLGNSYPGCACIREGKGMINMFQSMPTAVHVM
jgi:hypothetical protein